MLKTLWMMAFVVLLGCGGATSDSETVPVSPMVTDSSKRDVVWFELDSTVLSGPGKDRLDGMVNWLKDHPNRVITVHGYADDTGSVPHNLTLSIDRARAVKHYLSTQGIPENQVIVVGHGEAGPELPDNMERRAVFIADDTSK